MNSIDTRNYRYRFTGHEKVLHNVNAADALPDLLDLFEYSRVFIVCSRTINTKTDIVAKIKVALGHRLVGLSDEVGEHAPLKNVLKAARQVRDACADVIVAIGGGSVMDMCKTIQLCLSEDTFDRDSLLKLQFVLSKDGTELLTTSTALPKIRQIAIPTTLACAEWTPASTPIDEETRLKARFIVPDGSPQGIIYDPEILAQTPLHLLLSTGIRGLDHAINTVCSSSPHPFASVLAEKAVQLFMENLPCLEDPTDRRAYTNCQLAAWYTGMGQMSVPHGFSHWMVHIIGPYGSVAHSDAACVLMLAQAKWLEGWAVSEHNRLIKALGYADGQPFHQFLEGLLHKLRMPTTLEDLGLSREMVEAMIGPALDHPMMTRNNIRPIETAADIKAVLAFAWRQEALRR